MRANGSRFGALPYALSLTLPLSALVAVRAEGWGTLATVVLFAGVIPLVDALAPKILPSPAADLDQPGFRAILHAFPPLTALVWLLGVARFGSDGFGLELLGAALSVGLAGSCAVIAAHELIHARSKRERLCGYALMAMLSYVHFGLSHRVGHHRRTATLEDPSTARRGESLYRYLPRAIAGAWRACVRHTTRDLRARGRSGLHPSNPLWLFVLVPLAVVGLAFALGGWAGVAFHAVQAAVAVLILETVSYLQHYGLLRDRRPDGRYAPLDARHSWGCRVRPSNAFLLNVQRHAEHHADCNRSYTGLAYEVRSPELPAGYPVMIAAALVPSLWRRLVDPLVPSSAN